MKTLPCAAIPDRVPEDKALWRTSRQLWPMRLATSTTGQACSRKHTAHSGWWLTSPTRDWHQQKGQQKSKAAKTDTDSAMSSLRRELHVALSSGPFAVRRLGRRCDAEGRLANRCLSEASFDSQPRRRAAPSAVARTARRLFPSPFWPLKKGTPEGCSLAEPPHQARRS